MNDIKQNIILYCGSFNPIHNGHLEVASNVLKYLSNSELWFVVSPQNPFKIESELAPEQDRFEMCRLAVEDARERGRMKVCDVEFDMEQPTRTINTLRRLESLYPGRELLLLIGSDNVDDFDKWRDYEAILSDYQVLVYPRAGHTPQNIKLLNKMTLLSDLPLQPVMATRIRALIANGEEYESLVPQCVAQYIDENLVYNIKSCYQSLIDQGKLNYRKGLFDQALNNFLDARSIDPSGSEAGEFISIIKEILEFRHIDIYNP